MANARGRENTYDPNQPDDKRYPPNKPGKADLAREGYEVLDRADGGQQRAGLTPSTRYSRFKRDQY